MALYGTKEELDKFLERASVEPFSSATQALQIGNLITSLEAREDQMLKEVFGSNSTPMTRKKLIENIHQCQKEFPKLSKINGNTIRQIVVQYLANIKDKDAKEQARFQAALEQTWAEKAEKDVNGKPMEGLIGGLIQEIANTTFESYSELHPNQKTLGSRRVNVELKALKDKTSSQINEIYLTDLPEVTQSRIRRWLKDQDFGIDEAHLSSGIKRKKDALLVNTDLDWYAYTKGYKGEDAKKRLSPTVLRKRITAFKDGFKQFIGSDIPHIDEILNYVLDKDPTAIFVGANEKDIIGLAGEIQALCYLAYLLQDNFSLGSNKVVDWTATATKKGEGKQFHADITLKEFGIQVKNSYTDLTKDIGFVESSLDTFLNHLKQQGVITEEVQEMLVSIGEAYYFNIPYNFDINENNELSAWNEDSPAFQPTRDKIESLYEAFENVLNLLVGSLLYIGVGDATKNETGNILFFVKGEPIFASTILLQILNKITEAIDNFHMSLTYNSTFTIVTLLNQEKFSVWNHPSLSGWFDNHVRSKILLQSSYNFQGLYNNVKVK